MQQTNVAAPCAEILALRQVKGGEQDHIHQYQQGKEDGQQDALTTDIPFSENHIMTVQNHRNNHKCNQKTCLLKNKQLLCKYRQVIYFRIVIVVTNVICYLISDIMSGRNLAIQ